MCAIVFRASAVIPPPRSMPNTRTAFQFALASTAFLSAACRSATPRPVTAPVAQARSLSSAAPSTQSSTAIAPTDARVTATAGGSASPLASADLTRAVASVFGDSAPLPDSAALAALAPDESPAWDIDVRSYETHERVAHYVGIFSGSSKERFLTRLSRGTRYDPMIRAKLRAGGLPEDMTYLALIESGYDPHAYSRAAAVGMWQFMSSTARAVGMRVDWWVDERRDPARSTDGAIRFLRELQQQFGGSLYLAAAAYNGGPGRVSRGLTRFAEEMDGSAGEDRFFALAEQDYLRAETKNYVPQLIAAALVAKMPARYGISVDTVAPYAYDSVRVAAGTSLAAVGGASGATVAELRDLNPALLRGIAPPDAAYWVKVPVGRGDTTRLALDALPESARRGFTMRTVSGTKFTPASFASSVGVSAGALASFNPGMKKTKKGRLVSGQSLRIPSADALTLARDVPDPSIERYGTSASKATASSAYTVRRGETLGAVAKKHGLTVARLKALNGIKGNRVIAGQTLRVKGTPRSASAGKSTAKKSTAKTSTARKSTAKGATGKKSTAKKATASKATASKATASKTSASKKPSAKKTAPKGRR